MFKQVCFVIVVAMALASPASAQTPAPAASSHAASISAAGGLSAGASTSGPSVGTTFTYDVTRHIAFEGTGTFLDRGNGSTALSLNMGVRVNLVASPRATPYLTVGGGLYRASFDMDDRRFMTGFPTLWPGSQMISVRGPEGVVGFQLRRDSSGTMMNAVVIGPLIRPESMPGFYMDRMGTINVSIDGRMGQRAFTDPALTLGGGLDLHVTSRLFVRPDARALVVFRNGTTHTVGLMTFSFGVTF